jgi:hypothetical protein
MARNRSSHHQRAHGVEGSAERVKHEAKDLEGDDADQRFSVTRLAEDDRRVALAVRETEEALGNGPADGRAVGEHEVHLALWRESDGPPHRFGKERVGRSAVDQEADGGFCTCRPADGSLNVADTHAPEDEARRRKRRHWKFARRGEIAPGHGDTDSSPLPSREGKR